MLQKQEILLTIFKKHIYTNFFFHKKAYSDNYFSTRDFSDRNVGDIKEEIDETNLLKALPDYITSILYNSIMQNILQSVSEGGKNVKIQDYRKLSKVDSHKNKKDYKQDCRPAPAYFSPEYRNFHQHKQTVKNETTV